MTDATLLPFDLSAVRRKKLTADFGGGNQSSNGGLLLLRSAERKLRVCRRLADAMPDHRDASRIRHAMFEMVMARVCAIACGHEDAIDLDRLRHDPLMKVAVGRCTQSGAPLASQSTISRLENAGSKARQPSARSGADVRRHVRFSRAAMATDRWIQDVAGALEERGRQYAPDHCGVLDGYTTLSGGWLTACGTGSCPGVAPMPKLLGLRALPPAVKTRGAHDTLFDAPRCPVGRPSRRCRRSGGPETARRPARP
jgi:DDE family transposase